MKNLKKGLKRKAQEKKKKFMVAMSTMALYVVFFANQVFASEVGDPDTLFDSLVDTVAGWVWKIAILALGLSIAEYGWGHHSNDPEKKTMGIRAAVGSVLVGVGAWFLENNL